MMQHAIHGPMPAYLRSTRYQTFISVAPRLLPLPPLRLASPMAWRASPRRDLDSTADHFLGLRHCKIDSLRAQ